MLVDSHCHIDGERFDDDREEVIQRALEAGVLAMVNVGTGSPRDSSFEDTVALTKEYECIYGTVGIHPHDASEYDDSTEERLKELSSNEKILAWGEIGLDYHYDHSPRDTQRKVFERQIVIAQELELPIVIHSRSANRDTLDILKNNCSDKDFCGGIMHCFGGTPKMASELMDLGFLISFAGNVTFKKADELRDAARVVPLDRLLVETDCPYLTPVPYRGKRNEPARVVDTARFLADFYEIPFEKLARQTTANFTSFFNLELS
ncbi:MAG: TatD family hydrolase [Pyrinomonadaceae bacterium]|nr:TatD family hydrolase [Pyrinomonadaceae bacterium]